MSYSRQSAARYDGALSENFLTHCLEHLKEFDVPVNVSEDSLALSLPQASYRFERDPRGFSVSIKAESGLSLHQARESFLYLIDHVQPGLSETLRWSGNVARNGAPPNLYHGEVVSVSRVVRQFLRVVLDCADTPALAQGPGMHFSLLIPPGGRRPVWPQLDDNGRTIWPDGEDKLHRSVYTFVDFVPELGRFSFDIFEHDGSRTTDWVRTARVGDLVGIMGPGGGDFPPGENLLIAGDETALPAIRRILQSSDPARRGQAYIEVEDETDCSPLVAPTSLSVTWVIRNKGETLWDQLSEAIPPENSRYVWVAAERTLVRLAKTRFRDEFGLRSDESYFSGYWVR
ncbi:hypothetical protein P775_05190 [Puniceibacterium antarcticum]|uniref:FAD-binding FR-type domain-containing protein n=1 Tax=Puniceibacterium antarcticum TaxID=1206336 RepID=A0A2G8RIJ5_9RHOB|nr:siderophore-interacting protein [Puniceibacterium antarcticum]PIL21385.1 hypothetical protein P775_05190 [Puniceibacterium antarcticum]